MTLTRNLPHFLLGAAAANARSNVAGTGAGAGAGANNSLSNSGDSNSTDDGDSNSTDDGDSNSDDGNSSSSDEGDSNSTDGKGDSGRGDSGKGDSGRGDSGKGDSGKGEGEGEGEGEDEDEDEDEDESPITSAVVTPPAIAVTARADPIHVLCRLMNAVMRVHMVPPNIILLYHHIMTERQRALIRGRLWRANNPGLTEVIRMNTGNRVYLGVGHANPGYTSLGTIHQIPAWLRGEHGGRYGELRRLPNDPRYAYLFNTKVEYEHALRVARNREKRARQKAQENAAVKMQYLWRRAMRRHPDDSLAHRVTALRRGGFDKEANNARHAAGIRRTRR